jgi:ATP-dependent Clp protease ATP-binding subunit ClpC
MTYRPSLAGKEADVPSSKDRRRLEVPLALHARLAQMADAEGRTVASLVHDLLLTALRNYQPVWVPSKHLGRLNPRARRVLALAQEEAAGLNHPFIGTEHLLLGLLREEQGVAAQTLNALGLTLTGARAAVREIYARAAGSASVRRGDAPAADRDYTWRTRAVLGLALDEVQRRGDSVVRTEHLLLALVREGGGLGVEILDDGGILGKVRGQILAALGRADLNVGDANTRHAAPETTAPNEGAPEESPIAGEPTETP